MTRYGKLWQEAADIRARLKLLLPGLAGNFTPEEVKLRAREQMTRFVSNVDTLADEWTALEREMAQEPDDR